MSERHDRDERVSLHGLDPEEALRALLAVKPEDQPIKADEGSNQPVEDERPA